MFQQEIVNKMFLLDIGLIRPKLNALVNELLWKKLFIQNPTFKEVHKLERALVNRVICRIIKDTNDTPVYPLLEDDIFLIDIGRDLDMYANVIHTSMHIAYDKVFRFHDNVEVNVDANVSGNNVTVFTYENRLD